MITLSLYVQRTVSHVSSLKRRDPLGKGEVEGAGELQPAFRLYSFQNAEQRKHKTASQAKNQNVRSGEFRTTSRFDRWSIRCYRLNLEIISSQEPQHLLRDLLCVRLNREMSRV
jgi:hypothetical protein